jgi:hypothetical protein
MPHLGYNIYFIDLSEYLDIYLYPLYKYHMTLSFLLCLYNIVILYNTSKL